MYWKGLGRKRSYNNWGIVLEFACRDWGKNKKTLSQNSEDSIQVPSKYDGIDICHMLGCLRYESLHSKHATENSDSAYVIRLVRETCVLHAASLPSELTRTLLLCKDEFLLVTYWIVDSMLWHQQSHFLSEILPVISTVERATVQCLDELK
jgi:hypothetical protein